MLILSIAVGGKISFGMFTYAKIDIKNMKTRRMWFKRGLSIENSIKLRIIRIP
jgi:hypothetical protein